LKVKICGITNLKDALFACNSGADALGFVFYKKSPRYIEVNQAKEIIKKLPPFVQKVALFVNEDANIINEICHTIKANTAQIHFEAPNSLYEQLNIPHIKVIRASKKDDVYKYQNEYRLVDAYCTSYGGSGKRLNLEWFSDIDTSKIIIAGGLTPYNLDELKPYNFYAADVSSGVEAYKGKKDFKKVREFIENANK